MKILITGGAGFIGSSLANRLVNDHDVKVIDNLSYGYRSNLRDEIKFVEADITDDVSSHFENVDVVFHFAAISPLPDNQNDPARSIRNNVEGTANVLEISRLAGVKHLVMASTSAIYENNDEKILSEDLETDPDLIYATTKKCAELLCRSFSSSYNLPITILRFFNVYGPHQDFQRQHPPLMGYIIREILNDRVPSLHSDGNQRRDYVHIDDVCRLCESVMMNERSFNQTMNVCSGESHSVNEIYSLCAERLKTDIRPNFKRADRLWDSYSGLFEGQYSMSRSRIEKETNKFSMGTFEKAFKLVGWKPSVEFKKGVTNTVDEMIKFVRVSNG